MEIFLLRHGISEANEKNLVTGNKLDSLSPKGIKQAALARKLIEYYGLNFDTYYFTSNWLRAQETAKIVLPDKIFCIEPLLGETEAGKFGMMPIMEFNHHYPEFWQEFSVERPYPGGESHRSLFNRAIQWFETISNNFKQNSRILAVAHAGSICCILHHICHVSLDRFPVFLPENASLTKIERKSDNSWQLIFFSLTLP